jgi:hypothetical protein
MVPVSRWELYRLRATKAPQKRSHETLWLERWGLLFQATPFPLSLPVLPVDDDDGDDEKDKYGEVDEEDEEDEAGAGCLVGGEDAEPHVLPVVILDQPNSINPLGLSIVMIVQFFYSARCMAME